MQTLGDEVPKEQARVREILVAYREMGPACRFAAAIAEEALQSADKAVISGDVVEMIRAYQQLKGIK